MARQEIKKLRFESRYTRVSVEHTHSLEQKIQLTEMFPCLQQ